MIFSQHRDFIQTFNANIEQPSGRKVPNLTFLKPLSLICGLGQKLALRSPWVWSVVVFPIENFFFEQERLFFKQS